MDIMEKIRALTENEEFVEAFKEVKTAEEVVELYARYDVEVPMEIAQELFETEECDLDEEQLDEVAGGGLLSSAISWVYYGAGYVGARIAGWDKQKSKKYAKNCKTVGKVIGTALEWAM